MSVEALLARGFQLLLALTGAYTVALWFALIVWTFRDIESRSRSVIAQIFSTLVVALFFLPGALIYLILRPRETLDEAFGRALEEEYLLQDLEDLSLCANCHRPVRDDFVACPHCYTELRRHCPSCARLVDMVWALCPYCTADLAEQPAVLPEAPWREPQPRLAPHPLRVLREQTEVRVRHSLDYGAHDHSPRLPEGEAAQPPLLARETRETGSWADDTGKRSWIITRAREVFAPLFPIDTTARADGRGGHPMNGAAQSEDCPDAAAPPEPAAEPAAAVVARDDRPETAGVAYTVHHVNGADHPGDEDAVAPLAATPRRAPGRRPSRADGASPDAGELDDRPEHP